MVPKTICHIPINFTMISSASFQKLPNGDEKTINIKKTPSSLPSSQKPLNQYSTVTSSAQLTIVITIFCYVYIS